MQRRIFPSTLAATAALALTLSLSSAGQGAAQSTVEGAKVGTWKTWVLSSPTEIPVPAPPADSSDQTKKELEELRQLQAQRSEMTDTTIQYYNAVPATQRWNDLALSISAVEKVNNNRRVRLEGILHTAFADAVVATWAAKYAYNRKPPSQLAPDLTVVVPVAGPTRPVEPSYPSEDAAIAGVAVGILSAMFPNQANDVKAVAAEIQQTRLQMGANYRSDLDAGFNLGQEVAKRALARAATDGSDQKWTGTVPTGEGLWAPAAGASPVEPLEGTWKPWLMARGDQFRPSPPPKFGSAEFLAELALVKQLSSNPTPAQRALAVTVAADPIRFNWDPIYAVIQRERLTIPRETRVTALIAAVQHDATIAGHDTKYTYWQPRPSMADPTIVPYIALPSHPSYVSNAAIIAGAYAEMAAYLFPQDAARFRVLASQSGWSRIYGGIHYPSDERVAGEMGKQLAALAIARDQSIGN